MPTFGPGGFVRLQTPEGVTWYAPSTRGLRAYRAEDMAAAIAGSAVEPLPEAPVFSDGLRAYAAPWQAEAHAITRAKGWARLCEPSRLGCQPACAPWCPGCVITRVRVDHAPRKRGAEAFDGYPFRHGRHHVAVLRIGTRDERVEDREGEPPELLRLPYYRSRWVLLHELAHLAIGGQPKRHGHDRAFARKLLELVDWRLGRRVAGAALRQAYEIEGIRPFARSAR